MSIKFKANVVSAFALSEVVIALGVASISLLVLLSLMSVGVRSNRDSVEQTASASIAEEILSDLSSATSGQGNFIVSPRFGFTIPLPGSPATWPNTVYFSASDQFTQAGQTPLALPSGAIPRYRASVSLSPSGSGYPGNISVRVLITWPALADSDPAVKPVNFAGSFEVVTVLGSK